MRIYALTPLTRRALDQRRAVLSGIDVPWRVVKVLGIGALPSLLVAFMAWSFVGTWALVAFVLGEACTWWLVESRDTTGLRVRRWRGLLDRRQAHLGVLVVCGEPVIGRQGRKAQVVSSSVRVLKSEVTMEDLFRSGR